MRSGDNLDPMPEAILTADSRVGRWRIVVFVAITLVGLAADHWFRRAERAARRMPANQYLSITSSVRRGPGSPMLAPHLSVMAPGGRRSGFDPKTGTIQHGLPGMYRRGERSAHSEQDLLLASEAEQGTYVVEVIGAATGAYDLSIGAGGTSSTKLHTIAGRWLRDSPIVEGAVHRYQVKYSYGSEATALPAILSTNAPAPGAPSQAPGEQDTRPPRLSITIRNGCDSGPPGSVRLRTPGGRTAGYDRTGTTLGEDVPGVSVANSGNGFTIRELVDGEYVLEISPAEAATSYHLHVDLRTPTMHYDVQPQSLNCAETTVAPGKVHRWTIRLAQGTDFPVRVTWPGAAVGSSPDH